jgi:hypothetical protein
VGFLIFYLGCAGCLFLKYVLTTSVTALRKAPVTGASVNLASGVDLT